MEISVDKLSVICHRWHISKLSLFGSVLRDDFTPTSDVNVLVEFETGFTPGFLRLYQLQEELSDCLGKRPIDLVTFKSLNPRIRDHILETAETCYVA
ncbi:MAG: nucleotidyltransferase, partial [Oscillatoriales cyanobacterium]